MRKFQNMIFTSLIYVLTISVVMVLAFVIYFIVREALPFFEAVSISEFLLGGRWMPIDYTGNVAFGIGNFIAGTIYVSLIAVLIAAFVGIGTAVFLSCVATDKMRNYICPAIDLLAAIPSIVYGFVGIVILIRLFIRAGHPSGASVLAAAMVLSIMILPFMVSSITDTLIKLREKYIPVSEALGVEKWHAIAYIILPLSGKSIMVSTALATGRAMGETMAVMMVMGNANIFPMLLGKGETIASLIALEMGTAAGGSLHYHALFAAGFTLMIILFIINTGINLIRNRLLG